MTKNVNVVKSDVFDAFKVACAIVVSVISIGVGNFGLSAVFGNVVSVCCNPLQFVGIGFINIDKIAADFFTITVFTKFIPDTVGGRVGKEPDMIVKHIC